MSVSNQVGYSHGVWSVEALTSLILQVVQSSTNPLVLSGTLTANNSVALSPPSHNVVLSPTGTGVVTIAPATAGTMDNVVIGGTTPLAVHATAFTATGVAAFSNASVSMTALPVADPHVVGVLWANSHVVTVSNG